MFKRLALMILCMFVLLAAPIPVLTQSDEDPIVRIDQAINTITENDSFSGAVLIARDGEILLSKGYGLANREWDVPNTPDTKFRIGSVTKQFTGMAILILQERGLLTVQDLVCKYIEACPETWGNITIHHLLTHTSGIPNFTEFGDYVRTQMVPSSPENTIERFINQPLDFEPGEEFYYSNSGYIVLGYIIEQVSDDSYQIFLRQNIFEPLGMENTGYDSDTNVIGHRAEGYSSSRRRADYIHMSIPYAAGALYSTVEDLYLWDQALYSGEVVSQESWDSMLESAYVFPDGNQYGYGLFINNTGKNPSIGHPGGINGFTSVIAHYTNENVTIIVMSNFASSSSDSIARVLEGVLFND